MKRRLNAILLALPVAAASVLAVCSQAVRAEASAAPPYFDGADCTGVMPMMASCPVEVEKQTVNISVAEFPKWSPYTASEFAAYNYKAQVKTEYALYNPTEEDVSLSLLFPCGRIPCYAPCDEGFSFYDCAHRAVTVDGSEVQPAVRHTYTASNYDNYANAWNELQTGFSSLAEERDCFFQEDMPVTEIVYTITSRGSGNDYGWVYFNLSFDCNPKKTRILSPTYCNMRIENGRGRISYGFNDTAAKSFTLKFFVVGEALENVSTCLSQFSRRMQQSEQEPDFVSISGGEPREMGPFAEFALRDRPQNSAISESDWYGGFTDMLEQNVVCDYMLYLPEPLTEAHFLRWYAYSVDIPAGGRVSTGVSMPIYPTMEGGSAQDVFTYNFLLSPSQRWAGFNGIEINIDTPYYISDSTLEFTAREGGYTFTRDRLPQGELSFSLTEQERTYVDPYRPYPDGGDPLATAIIVLSVLVVGTIVVVTVLVVRNKKRKAARAAVETRMRMGRTEEGKIDLPPDDTND